MTSKFPVFVFLTTAFSAMSVVAYSQAPKKNVGGHELYSFIPGLFAPDIVSTSLDELNSTLSRDDDTVYFSVTAPKDKLAIIMFSTLYRGKWTKPEKATFSTGTDVDCDPYLSPDGKRLLFISNREAAQTRYSRKNFDIFYVEFKNGKWSEPSNVGRGVNDSNDQYYPAVAGNNNLYFSTQKDSSYDIFCAQYVDGKYSKPYRLPGLINSSKNEVDITVAPDETFIILTIYGRSDSKGNGDLYISFYENGEWTEPLHLGEGINSPAREYCPYWKDGYLYFTSTRGVFDEPLKKPLASYSELKTSINRVLNGLGNIYKVKLDRKMIMQIRLQKNSKIGK